MNKYLWIDFEVDLRRLPHTAWVQLGECQSKCVHLSRVPLKPGFRDEMHRIYLAKGAQATTAIEGNTLTEEEVKLRIDNKLELPPSKEYLGQEIDNILELCNEISNELDEEANIRISPQQICRYNEVILKKAPAQDHVIPGKFRQCAVGVGSYTPPDYQDVPGLVDRLCTWLNSDYFITVKDNKIIDSIIKAIVAHLYMAWIHPFGDGNGRVGRILEFAILMSSGVPSPAAHLLSNHYNVTRTEYYRHLDLASRRKDATAFISYAIQGFLDGLNDQLDYVFTQTLMISWESFIYELFEKESYSEPRTKRIRTLVLELSRQPDPVPKNRITTLSQELVEYYRKRTPKTIERDLHDLEKMGLIENLESGYRALTEKILAFLPRVTNP